MEKIKKRFIVTASFLISLAVMMSIFFLLLYNDVTREKERCHYILLNEAGDIVTTVDSVLARAGTLKIMVQDHNGDISFFDKAAQDIYSDVLYDTGVTLKNIAVAPDGVVSRVFPYRGNEEFLGFDFMDQSREGNTEAVEAYKKNDLILTNPFELVQGGQGMAGREGVWIEKDGEHKLWGLVTVTIDMKNLLHVLELHFLSDMGLNYQLSYIDGNGGRHPMKAYGSVGKDAETVQFEVENLTWELSAIPKNGWFSVPRVILGVLFIIVIASFASAFTNLLITLNNTNEELLRISNTDRLTGCLNRRSYEDALERFHNDPPGEGFVLASVDINGLKKANDNLGHAAGDELIRGASDCLHRVFDACGRIYRVGGDEFVVLFFSDGERLDRLKSDLEEAANAWKGLTVDSLSLSVGYAPVADFPGAKISELAKEADKRMYEAKKEYYNKSGNDRRR